MKLRSLYFYVGLLIYLALLAFLLSISQLNTTGLGITLAFLTLIFVPGIMLARIFRFSAEALIFKILTIIGLGFGYYFFFALISIVFNLTIVQFVWLITGGLIISYVIALFRDYHLYLEFDWQKLKKGFGWADILMLVLMIIASAIAFTGINAQSDKLIGDGWFHLAILQKVTGGEGLNPYNLWIEKTTSLNLVYSFPVWHILLGGFLKILNITIFTALRQVILPLTIFAVIVWYGLIAVIFRNKYAIFIGYLTFLLVFLKDDTFYFLVALPSPDSIVRLLFLPLIFALSINYLFGQEAKLKQIILIAFLAIFMGLIHFPQIIYFYWLVFVFAIIFAIFEHRQKEVLKRLGYLVLGLVAIIMPYLIFLSFKGIIGSVAAGLGATAVDNGANKSYLDANIIYRYAVFSVPVVLLFSRTRKALLFLSSILIGLLLISWQAFGLRSVFFKYFGEIFVSRALGNIPHEIFLGFGLYLVIAGLVWLISKSGKIGTWIANGILIIFGIVILISSGLRQLLGDFVYQYLFNLKNGFTDKYFWLILIIISLVIIGIYFWFYFNKKEIKLPEIKKRPSFVIIGIILILIFSLPYEGKFAKVLAANPNGGLLTNRETTSASDIRKIGGEKTLEFLQDLPPKSVIMTSNPTMSQMVVLYSDQFVAGYPFDDASKVYAKIAPAFYPNTTLSQRQAIFDQYQVDYIIVQRTDENQFFTQHPEYFKPVFENYYQYQVEENGVNREKQVTIFIYQYLK